MRWYQKTWATVLLLFLFAPVGIFLLWKYQNWSNTAKIVLTCFFGLIFIAILSPSSEGSELSTLASVVVDEEPTLKPELTPEPENEAITIFGEIQIFDVMNETGTSKIGERGVVVADKSLMSDLDLIEFFNSNIIESATLWYAIDFGDGTGYVFGRESNHFVYIYQHEDDWSQTDPEMKKGMGFVYYDSVEFHLALRVSILTTINEYWEWAIRNGLDFRLLDENGNTLFDNTLRVTTSTRDLMGMKL